MMLFLALALAASAQLDRCLNSGRAAQGVTSAISACFVADYKQADARLNDTYRALMKRLPAARQPALRISQRAWIKRRDRACQMDDSVGAGTIELSNHPACLTKQTNRRIAWLAQFR